MKEKILLIAIIILSAVSVVGAIGDFRSNNNDEIALSGRNTTDCAVSTVTSAGIGNEESSTLLALASNRAWAIIEQPINATNTVSLSFDEGAAATLADGIELQNASTTNGRTYMKFGLSTDFPYTGVVTGITDAGSTTVRITQCLYN